MPWGIQNSPYPFDDPLWSDAHARLVLQPVGLRLDGWLSSARPPSPFSSLTWYFGGGLALARDNGLHGPPGPNLRGRTHGPVPPRRLRRRRCPWGTFRTLPRPPPSDGQPAHGPPYAGPARRLRCAPGGVPRDGRLAGRLPARTDDSVLSVAADVDGAETARAAPETPRQSGPE